MEDYLKYFKLENKYNELSKREDHFIQIEKFFTNWQKNKSSLKLSKNLERTFENFSKFEDIFFNATKNLYEGKKFRDLVPGTKSKTKSYLSNQIGLDEVHKIYIEKNTKTNDYDSLKTLKGALKAAEKEISRKDKTHEIKDWVEKINKNSKNILEWANNIKDGKIFEDVEFIKEIEKSINRLKKALKHFKDM